MKRELYYTQKKKPSKEYGFRKRTILMSFLLVFALVVSISPLEGAYQVHRVQPSESLYRIAGMYQTSVTNIIEINNLENPDRISPNEVLIVPQLREGTSYIIQPGDTLWKIGIEFGRTVDRITSYNGIGNPNMIYPGQHILIPPPLIPKTPEGTPYVIQPGDTLGKIASEYGTTVDRITSYNGIGNPNIIYAGQEIIIPPPNWQGTEPEAPQPPQYDYNLPDLMRKFPGLIHLRGPQTEKVIALTFDDGPDAVYTPQILDVLSEMGVKATFFVVGENVRRHPGVTQRIIDEGHVIASHSDTHPNLRYLEPELIEKEMAVTSQTIEEVVGKSVALMRPPYGDLSVEACEIIRDMGMKIINWSVDSDDWRGLSTDQLLINMLPEIGGGSIVLMHSNGGDLSGNAQAVRELIYTLRLRGYEFVTVDELLSLPAYH